MSLEFSCPGKSTLIIDMQFSTWVTGKQYYNGTCNGKFRITKRASTSQMYWNTDIPIPIYDDTRHYLSEVSPEYHRAYIFRY